MPQLSRSSSFIIGRRSAAIAVILSFACDKPATSTLSRNRAQIAQAAVLDIYRSPVTRLRGRIRTLPNELTDPSAVTVAGGSLWVIDRAGAGHTILAIDAKTGRVSARIRAEDTARVAGAWSFDNPDAAVGRIWVFDAPHRKMLLVALDTSVSGNLIVSREFSLQSKSILTGAKWLTDSSLVSPGFLSAGRLAMFDAKGHLLQTIGQAPLGQSGTAVDVVEHAYQSTVAFNPERTLMALATRYADEIDILAVDGTLKAVAERPFGFAPYYTVVKFQRGSAANLQYARFGYVDVVADSNHVFALFSGKLSPGYHGQANYGRYVHVFDWKGRLLRVVELGDDALSIALNHQSGELFALGAPPDPQIKSYLVADVVGRSSR